MTLSELIRAKEGVPISQSGLSATKEGLNWPKNAKNKIVPEIANSALSGDLTAVTLVTNHFIFIH